MRLRLEGLYCDHCHRLVVDHSGTRPGPMHDENYRPPAGAYSRSGLPIICYDDCRAGVEDLAEAVPGILFQ